MSLGGVEQGGDDLRGHLLGQQGLSPGRDGDLEEGRRRFFFFFGSLAHEPLRRAHQIRRRRRRRRRRESLSGCCCCCRCRSRSRSRSNEGSSAHEWRPLSPSFSFVTIKYHGGEQHPGPRGRRGAPAAARGGPRGVLRQEADELRFAAGGDGDGAVGGAEVDPDGGGRGRGGLRVKEEEEREEVER